MCHAGAMLASHFSPDQVLGSIHPSLWKRDSQKCAHTEFSEIQGAPGLWTGTLLSVIVSSVEARAKGVKGG